MVLSWPEISLLLKVLKRKVHKHQTKETLDLFLPYEVYSETEYISIMLTSNLEL